MVGGKAGIQAGKKVENRKQCKQEGRKEENTARQRKKARIKSGKK